MIYFKKYFLITLWFSPIPSLSLIFLFIIEVYITKFLPSLSKINKKEILSSYTSVCHQKGKWTVTNSR